MLAALLPLIPILAQVVPQIASWLGGDDAEDVARQVTTVVSAVAGGTDEAAVAAAMADPKQRAALVEQLARISAEREKVRDAAITERLKATLIDLADARQQTIALASRGSRLAWMPAIVTFILLLVFGATLLVVFTGAIPAANTRLADQLIGGIYTLVTTAVAYWVGTSRGAVEMRQGLEQAAHNPPPTRRLFGDHT
jgi:hypothetical protein